MSRRIWFATHYGWLRDRQRGPTDDDGATDLWQNCSCSLPFENQTEPQGYKSGSDGQHNGRTTTKGIIGLELPLYLIPNPVDRQRMSTRKPSTRISGTPAFPSGTDGTAPAVVSAAISTA